MLSFAKENFGVKDIENLTGQHIQSYLETKIEMGVKHSTFMQYASAVEKLQVALNAYANNHNTGKEYNFSDNIKEVREIAHKELERFTGSRAYENPKELINNIQTESFKLASTLQYEAGLRLKELAEIKSIKNNCIEVLGKGGKIREVEISNQLANELKEYLKSNDFKWSDAEKNAYREELQRASEMSGQSYNGSHGLRWNYAQEKMQALQQEGKSYEQSLIEVSQSMGHERADITEHYLK